MSTIVIIIVLVVVGVLVYSIFWTVDTSPAKVLNFKSMTYRRRGEDCPYVEDFPMKVSIQRKYITIEGDKKDTLRIESITYNRKTTYHCRDVNNNFVDIIHDKEKRKLTVFSNDNNYMVLYED